MATKWAYQYFTINGKMLGHGEPIRVKQGERILFHVLNGSATEIRSLALPGHTFRVVALDGNPVSTEARVPVLWYGNGGTNFGDCGDEPSGRLDHGDLADDDRGHGMGIVVEYAGQRWEKRNGSSHRRFTGIICDLEKWRRRASRMK